MNKWTKDAFFKEIQKLCGNETTRIAKALWDWAKEHHLDIVMGTGNQDGSFGPRFVFKNKGYSLFSVKTYGQIEVNFMYYKKYPPFDSTEKRMELLNKLNNVRNLYLISTTGQLPKFPCKKLQDQDMFLNFTGTFEWMMKEIVTQSLSEGV